MHKPAPTPYLIRGLRSFRLVLHFAWIGLGAAVIYPLVDENRRARLKQRWSHRILTLLAVRLDSPGTDAPPGCLIVANHISWLDIFAINALRPAAFIAKAEIRNWPFIGWLSARNDSVFLRRGSSGHARLINQEIDARLNAGKDVAIFPEGMTSDGTQLRGFHAALLQPAVETGHPILPLALSYHDADGQISLAPSYAAGTTLMKCYWSILACRNLTVRITPAPAIETPGKTRRELAALAHAAIAARLGYQERFSSGRQPT